MKSRSTINLGSMMGFYTKTFSLFSIAFSIMVVAGWVFDIEQIKIILPNSALGFFCGGLSLWFLQRKKIQPRGTQIGRALAVLTLLIGLLSLSKYIFSWNLGVDQFIVRALNLPADAFPARMAFITAVCFMLWGLALISIKSAASQYFSIAAVTLSMLAIIGHLFDRQSLYRLAGYDSVALPDAIIFILMMLATLAAKPQLGIMKIAASQETGGRAIRLFLPFTILSITFLGWLVIQGEQLGFFDPKNGIAVLIVLVILFYSFLLFLYAERINKSEDELKKFRFHDALTNLFNQSYFQEEISRLERGREYPVSILIADVDNMKTINDQYGRALGDLLLIQMAQTFASAFRANDVIARIGEDEFAVLLPATDRETAESLLRRVRQLIAERNKANPIVSTNLSLGIGTAQNALFLANALKEAGENLHQNRSKTIPHVKKIPTL